MTAALWVGAGGCIGAVTRYVLGLLPVNTVFPAITLIINFTGAFLIGLLSGIAEKQGWPDNVSLFLKTGFCGGFTTFSTFSLETFSLFQQGKATMGVLYAAGSVFLCLAGVWLGCIMAKTFA